MIEVSRRSLIRGAVATLFAAPAIVRCGSLMPVKAIDWWAGPPWLGDITFFSEDGDVIPKMWTGSHWLPHPLFRINPEIAERIVSKNILRVKGTGRMPVLGLKRQEA